LSLKRPRLGNPLVDGYELAAMVEPPLDYADAEVMGKYLALEPFYQEALDPSLKELFVDDDSSSAFLYPDFLQQLDKLHNLKESTKLQHRKKYGRFLTQLQLYLQEFLQRTIPLFHAANCIEPAIKAFESIWKESGGYKGWQAKPAEANMFPNDDDQGIVSRLVDLSKYETAQQLVEAVDGDVLKAELSRLGLKCGGTPLDRAKRLLLTKNTPLDQLPAKLFVKKPNSSTASAGHDGEQEGAETVGSFTTTPISDRRVDIARQEAIVAALLDQLAPTLEATIRRAERRLTQTLEEQDKELEEELFGTDTGTDAKRARNDGDSDDDSEDGPIYNPKNVPLDFDGKPIPYWLFKLHGLNHYYPCEICGGETYRGRRNFELHFADSKHTLGMRSLNIPNTKHFHGVTTIQDAQDLWPALQGKLQQEQFDNVREEEYEDSNGNVLSRATYEDLARQGLL
jgi:splicing factor 3A subunit 3